MATKVERLLAVLRGEALPEETPPAGEAAAPAADGAEAAALREKVAELEQKLTEMSAPPAMEPPPMQEAAVPPMEIPPGGEAPQAPSELSLFMQTRMELLEKKLELAQQEALRANILMRERDDAQRKAQREVEELFRGIREQQRAATWDRALRERNFSAQAQLRDLQVRLQTAQLRMVPAGEVLRCLETEEGRAELEARLRKQVEEASASPLPAAPGEDAPVPPVAPSAEAAAPGKELALQGPVRMDPPPGLETLAAVMGRLSDLERRIQESEEARERERQGRLRWEGDMLASLRETRRTWQKAGGPEMLVEAALESMVDCLRERDAAAAGMSAAVEALRAEPPGSEALPALKAGLAESRRRMDEAQEKLDKQMAMVQAWVERNKGTGERADA